MAVVLQHIVVMDSIDVNGLCIERVVAGIVIDSIGRILHVSRVAGHKAAPEATLVIGPVVHVLNVSVRLEARGRAAAAVGGRRRNVTTVGTLSVAKVTDLVHVDPQTYTCQLTRVFGAGSHFLRL